MKPSELLPLLCEVEERAGGRRRESAGQAAWFNDSAASNRKFHTLSAA